MMNEILTYWPSLATVYVACLVAFTSPGPNFIAISAHAVESRISGVGVATGISVGTATWALLAATGITAILNSYAGASIVVGVLGGLYLCWLGYKSFKSCFLKNALNFSSEISKDKLPLLSSFWTGILVQMTNPKTALFWLALTSIAITPNIPTVVLFVLVAGCLVIALIWHIMLAIVFSSGPVREVYLRFRYTIAFIFGCLFTLFGLSVVYGALMDINF